MSSLNPSTGVRLTVREILLLSIFLVGAAFTAGGAWVKIVSHEESGHAQYNRDISTINERLARIEEKLNAR